MQRILVTGSAGVIGSELTVELRKRYGNENVIAAGHKKKPPKSMLESGPFHFIDCRKIDEIAKIVNKYRVDTIYHLAAVITLAAEENPRLGWEVNIGGLLNVLEAARIYGCSVFFPSSIAAFGPGTPLTETPQDTIQRPNTMYGVTKTAGEMLCDYYFKRFGVDARGVRYPGIISYRTIPKGGTTDYSVEIFLGAVKEKKYTCYLKEGTYLEMMYMPDAIKAAIDLMNADPAKLKHRNAFNVAGMSVAPEDIAMSIKRIIPEFTMNFRIDPVRQAIADSWPNSMDDSAACQEWGWKNEWDIDSMTNDIIEKLS
jgi:nucleoside-diphosphate-sugar epimerase